MYSFLEVEQSKQMKVNGVYWGVQEFDIDLFDILLYGVSWNPTLHGFEVFIISLFVPIC